MLKCKKIISSGLLLSVLLLSISYSQSISYLSPSSGGQNAHDLQVYNGVVETDWAGERPYIGSPPKSRAQTVFDAEELARELERYNGDLPPSAE